MDAMGAVAVLATTALGLAWLVGRFLAWDVREDQERDTVSKQWLHEHQGKEWRL